MSLDLVLWLTLSGLNYPYLETKLHGPKDVLATEVQLYKGKTRKTPNGIMDRFYKTVNQKVNLGHQGR